jgi:hypothetical protein
MTYRMLFRPGFDPNKVAWGRPDSPPRPFCCYCSDHIPERAVPLTVWHSDGSTARFCNRCVERSFYITSNPEQRA